MMNPQIHRRDEAPSRQILVFGSFSEDEASALQSELFFNIERLSQLETLGGPISNQTAAVDTFAQCSGVGREAVPCVDRAQSAGLAPALTTKDPIPTSRPVLPLSAHHEDLSGTPEATVSETRHPDTRIPETRLPDTRNSETSILTQRHAVWGSSGEAIKEKVVTEVGLASGVRLQDGVPRAEPVDVGQLAALGPDELAGGRERIQDDSVNQHLPPLVDKLPLDIRQGHISDATKGNISEPLQGHSSHALQGHISEALQGHTSYAFQGHTPDSHNAVHMQPAVDKLALPSRGAPSQVSESVDSLAGQIGGVQIHDSTGGVKIHDSRTSQGVLGAVGDVASPSAALGASDPIPVPAAQEAKKAAPVSWAALLAPKAAQPTPARPPTQPVGPTSPAAATPAAGAAAGAVSRAGPTTTGAASRAGQTTATRGLESQTVATNGTAAQEEGGAGGAVLSAQSEGRHGLTPTTSLPHPPAPSPPAPAPSPPAPAAAAPAPAPAPPPLSAAPPAATPSAAAAPSGPTPPAAAAAAAPPPPPAAAAAAAAPPAAPPAAALGPRGFLNGGNLCFVNSTLQALIGCRPFVSLLNELQQAEGIDMECSPTVGCFVEFWKQLNKSKLPSASNAHVAASTTHVPPGLAKPAPTPQRGDTSVSTSGTPANVPGSGKAGVRSAPPSYAALAKGRALACLAPPVDPSATFERVLSTFSPQHHQNGLQIRQEDAQEFLSFLLERMHEELAGADTQLSQSAGAGTSGTPGEGVEGSPGGARPDVGSWINEDLIGEEEEGWETVGPRNKASITRQHTDKESKISSIFSGQLHSVIKTRGAKDSVTVQPFSVLQLDIARDAVRSVEDALLCFTEPEYLEGYRPQDGKGSHSVRASKVVKIKTLPRVLILHLMRFTYSARGSVKLHKPVAFPLYLTLTKDLIYAPAALGSTKAHTYKLFATVVHHGKEPSRGHYTADLRQQDDTWLRFDDANVLPIHASIVAKEQAYLLLYELT